MARGHCFCCLLFCTLKGLQAIHVRPHESCYSRLPLYSGLLKTGVTDSAKIIQEAVVIVEYIQSLLKTFYYCINFIAAITCPVLPAPSNGTRLGCTRNATMHYDTLCQFSCNDGYIGSGSQSRRCQQNGTWSGQDFTCQGM